jgi:hypothetical protein
MVWRPPRRNLATALVTNNPQSTPRATVATTTPSTSTAAPDVKPHRLIMLTVDVHWREHLVVRRTDNTATQPVQRFAPEAFVAWVASRSPCCNMSNLIH